MYAKQNTTYTKHQVHQTKTKFSNKNTKYAKQNTKYAKQNTKYWFTLFCREIIFVANLRTFWRTFYRPKKYGGVPKMSIIRYDMDMDMDKDMDIGMCFLACAW